MKFPKSVYIREVGLREGLQICPKIVALNDKLDIIKLLNKTGVKEIELTAFVRPDLVPQMADASELIQNAELLPSIRYTALALNQKGLDSAISTGRLQNRGWLYSSASETFFKKNNNSSIEKFLEELPSRVEGIAKHKIAFEGIMLSCAFGCAYEGNIEAQKVLQILEKITLKLNSLNANFTEVSLADTNGLATPESIESLLKLLQANMPQYNYSLHLHDTKGLGLVNAYVGLQCGVSIFETSVGGVGGCPFTKGAAGNLATEDFVYLCHSLGIETGIDLPAYIKVAKALESIVGRESLSGKYYRS
jgi:hydroxymethylglutaryl-CoA lyase